MCSKRDCLPWNFRAPLSGPTASPLGIVAFKESVEPMTLRAAPAAKPREAKGGFALLKSGLHAAEGMAAAYHIGKAVWQTGQAAAPYVAPYLLAAAV